MGDAVALILDGGPCSEGMESTVLDLTTEVPEILRPNLVAAEALRRVLGEVEYEPRYAVSGLRASPGQDPVHYAPNAQVELVSREGISARFTELERARERVVGITREPSPMPVSARTLVLSASPAGFSRELYAAFYAAEALEATVILVESPPSGDAWDAVRDRLARASSDR